MARYMLETDRLFRAVIIKHFADGLTHTECRGPFTTQAPATRAVNEEMSVLARKALYGWGQYKPYTLETRVEFVDPGVWTTK